MPCRSPTRTHSNRSRKKAKPHRQPEGWRPQRKALANRLSLVSPLWSCRRTRAGQLDECGQRAPHRPDLSECLGSPTQRRLQRAVAGGGGSWRCWRLDRRWSRRGRRRCWRRRRASGAGGKQRSVAISERRVRRTSLFLVGFDQQPVGIARLMSRRNVQRSRVCMASAMSRQRPRRRIACHGGNIRLEADGDQRHALLDFGSGDQRLAPARPAGCRASGHLWSAARPQRRRFRRHGHDVGLHRLDVALPEASRISR